MHDYRKADLSPKLTSRITELNVTEGSRVKKDDVIARLEPMAVPGKPFFGSAGELVAMAYVEQGKENLAGPLFAEIARDKNAPDALRARARQIAGLMGTDAIDDVKEVVDQIERNSAARQAALQQAAQQAGQ